MLYQELQEMIEKHIYYKEISNNAEITEHLLNVFKNGENNHEYKITSIVTKEQFESMSYKVEE